MSTALASSPNFKITRDACSALCYSRSSTAANRCFVRPGITWRAAAPVYFRRPNAGRPSCAIFTSLERVPFVDSDGKVLNIK